MNCYKCQSTLNDQMDFGRQDTCHKCRAHTRVCCNCIHYDPTRYNECTEPVADRVVDKEKGNFCDYFKPGFNAQFKGSEGGLSPAELARAKAEALFKKK